MLDVLFGTVSIFSLSAISLERMYAVKYPANHHNLNRTPFVVAITVTWLMAVIMTALKLKVPEKIYTLLLLVLVFLLPLVIIVLCYFVIFYTARNMFVATNQEGNLSRDLQVAKTISIIIGLFVVCWLPFFTINVCYYYGTNTTRQFFEENGITIVSITKGLHYSNSMMNFFVYAVKSPDFRETFKALLCSRIDGKALRERLRTLSNANMLQIRNSLRVTERLKSSRLGIVVNNGGTDVKNRFMEVSLDEEAALVQQSASSASTGSVSILDGQQQKLLVLTNSDDSVFK